MALGKTLAIAVLATILTPAMALAAVECPTAPPAAIPQVCQTCHGLDGHGGESFGGEGSATPDIAGQRYNFLVISLKGYRMGYQWQEDPDSVFFTEGMRINDDMGNAVASMKDDEIKTIAAWYSCQK